LAFSKMLMIDLGILAELHAESDSHSLLIESTLNLLSFLSLPLLICT
jgi:hypothetical protein